jgi:uncharacterized OB-fold protein
MTTQPPVKKYAKVLPVVDDESEPFWKGCKEHKLMIQKNASTGKLFFYPRAIAPGDPKAKVEWVQVSGKGKVHTFTVIRQNVAPGFRDELPYIVAIIDLDEGVQMMSNIVGTPPEQVTIGMPVKVQFEDVNEEISLPKFVKA